MQRQLASIRILKDDKDIIINQTQTEKMINLLDDLYPSNKTKLKTFIQDSIDIIGQQIMDKGSADPITFAIAEKRFYTEDIPKDDILREYELKTQYCKTVPGFECWIIDLLPIEKDI